MPSPLFTAILFADKTFRTVTNTLKDTNGRSNFNKALQYATKLLSLNLAETDPKNEWAASLNLASGTINTGRKLAGLGQWLDFLHANRSINWANPRDALRGLANTANVFFWIFDNVIFLQKAKLTTALSEDNKAGRYAMCAFWVAQLLSLVGEALDLKALQKKQADAVKKIRETQGEDKAAKVELLKLKTQLLWAYAGVVTRLANLTYSANGWNLTENVLGQQFSEKTCTYAGLLSAVLALAKNVDAAASK